MKIVLPEEWMPCDGLLLEKAAEKAIYSDSHVLVVAGPGSGKTELLAQKAAFLFQTNSCKEPQKILAISFKKDAADNLTARVEKRCRAEVSHRFNSVTYDTFAKSLLDHFLYALPSELRPNPDYLVNDDTVIEAAFKKAGYDNPNALNPSKLKNYLDLTLARVHLPIAGDSGAEKAWSLLLKGFDGFKATLSFKMITILAHYIVMTNPQIKRALQLTYSYVFLDEFQDTTGLQYDFVKECFLHSSSKITAVGDNKQRIMLWAGAKKGILNNFYIDFSPIPVRLQMNHRSAPRLVALQKQMYTSLKERVIEVTTSNKWDSTDGDITLVIADSEQLEAQAVVNDIMCNIAQGSKPSDICILCKQMPQNYTSAILLELEKYGIRARIENEYQDLIKDIIIDLLLMIMACSLNRKLPHEWVIIQDFLFDTWGLENVQGYDAHDQMQEKLYAKSDQLKSDMTKGFEREDLHNIFEDIISFLDINKLRARYPIYGQGEYLNELLNKFENLFWTELNLANGNYQIAIENFCGLHSIPIMTIHKSKGLEYSAVYFIGLEDSAFWNFRQQPEEDRCAFFVALSRAKRSVVFTYCKHRSNFQWSRQKHTEINEFFDLLQLPGMADIKEISIS